MGRLTQFRLDGLTRLNSSAAGNLYAPRGGNVVPGNFWYKFGTISQVVTIWNYSLKTDALFSFRI